eukprot:Rmarinus@m.14678
MNVESRFLRVHDALTAGRQITDSRQSLLQYSISELRYGAWDLGQGGETIIHHWILSGYLSNKGTPLRSLDSLPPPPFIDHCDFLLFLDSLNLYEMFTAVCETMAKLTFWNPSAQMEVFSSLLGLALAGMEDSIRAAERTTGSESVHRDPGATLLIWGVTRAKIAFSRLLCHVVRFVECHVANCCPALHVLVGRAVKRTEDLVVCPGARKAIALSVAGWTTGENENSGDIQQIVEDCLQALSADRGIFDPPKDPCSCFDGDGIRKIASMVGRVSVDSLPSCLPASFYEDFSANDPSRLSLLLPTSVASFLPVVPRGVSLPRLDVLPPRIQDVIRLCLTMEAQKPLSELLVWTTALHQAVSDFFSGGVECVAVNTAQEVEWVGMFLLECWFRVRAPDTVQRIGHPWEDIAPLASNIRTDLLRSIHRLSEKGRVLLARALWERSMSVRYMSDCLQVSSPEDRLSHMSSWWLLALCEEEKDGKLREMTTFFNKLSSNASPSTEGKDGTAVGVPPETRNTARALILWSPFEFLCQLLVAASCHYRMESLYCDLLLSLDRLALFRMPTFNRSCEDNEDPKSSKVNWTVSILSMALDVLLGSDVSYTSTRLVLSRHPDANGSQLAKFLAVLIFRLGKSLSSLHQLNESTPNDTPEDFRYISDLLYDILARVVLRNLSSGSSSHGLEFALTLVRQLLTSSMFEKTSQDVCDETNSSTVDKSRSHLRNDEGCGAAQPSRSPAIRSSTQIVGIVKLCGDSVVSAIVLASLDLLDVRRDIAGGRFSGEITEITDLLLLSLHTAVSDPHSSRLVSPVWSRLASRMVTMPWRVAVRLLPTMHLIASRAVVGVEKSEPRKEHSRGVEKTKPPIGQSRGARRRVLGPQLPMSLFVCESSPLRSVFIWNTTAPVGSSRGARSGIAPLAGGRQRSGRSAPPCHSTATAHSRCKGLIDPNDPADDSVPPYTVSRTVQPHSMRQGLSGPSRSADYARRTFQPHDAPLLRSGHMQVRTDPLVMVSAVADALWVAASAEGFVETMAKEIVQGGVLYAIYPRDDKQPLVRCKPSSPEGNLVGDCVHVAPWVVSDVLSINAADRYTVLRDALASVCQDISASEYFLLSRQLLPRICRLSILQRFQGSEYPCEQCVDVCVAPACVCLLATALCHPVARSLDTCRTEASIPCHALESMGLEEDATSVGGHIAGGDEHVTGGGPGAYLHAAQAAATFESLVSGFVVSSKSLWTIASAAPAETSRHGGCAPSVHERCLNACVVLTAVVKCLRTAEALGSQDSVDQLLPLGLDVIAFLQDAILLLPTSESATASAPTSVPQPTLEPQQPTPQPSPRPRSLEASGVPVDVPSESQRAPPHCCWCCVDSPNSRDSCSRGAAFVMALQAILQFLNGQSHMLPSHVLSPFLGIEGRPNSIPDVGLWDRAKSSGWLSDVVEWVLEETEAYQWHSVLKYKAA